MAKTSIRDRVRQRARERVQKTGNYINLPNNIGFLSPRVNETMRLDFLLYEVKESLHPDKLAVGDLWYQRPYRIHRNIGATNMSIICPTSFGKKCPICEERDKLIADGYDDHKDEIRALRPSERRLFYVIDLKAPDKILLYDVADYKNFPDLLDKEINAGKEEWASFPDLADGYTLSVRYSEDKIGGGKPFPVADRIDFTKREAYEETILGEMADLGECLVQMPYDQIEKIFLMIEDGDVDDASRAAAGDPDTPERPATGTSKFRKPAQDAPAAQETTPKETSAAPASGRRTPPRKNAPVSQPEPEKTQEPAARGSRKTSPKKEEAPAQSVNKCPGGHVWGQDCEKFDDCTDTGVCSDASWGACKDESERLAKAK